jgi:hypothetical protein
MLAPGDLTVLLPSIELKRQSPRLRSTIPAWSASPPSLAFRPGAAATLSSALTALPTLRPAQGDCNNRFLFDA